MLPFLLHYLGNGKLGLESKVMATASIFEVAIDVISVIVGSQSNFWFLMSSIICFSYLLDVNYVFYNFPEKDEIVRDHSCSVYSMSLFFVFLDNFFGRRIAVVM